MTLSRPPSLLIKRKALCVKTPTPTPTPSVLKVPKTNTNTPNLPTKKKPRPTAPAAHAKAITKLSSSVVVLPARTSQGSDQAVLPAAAKWSFNNTPAPVRHDQESHDVFDLMQLPNAMWNDPAFKKLLTSLTAPPFATADTSFPKS